MSEAACTLFAATKPQIKACKGLKRELRGPESSKREKNSRECKLGGLCRAREQANFRRQRMRHGDVKRLAKNNSPVYFQLFRLRPEQRAKQPRYSSGLWRIRWLAGRVVGHAVQTSCPDSLQFVIIAQISVNFPPSFVRMHHKRLMRRLEASEKPRIPPRTAPHPAIYEDSKQSKKTTVSYRHTFAYCVCRLKSHTFLCIQIPLPP